MSGTGRLCYGALPRDQQEFVNLVGIDLYKDIVLVYGGTSLYIPKLETLERQSRDEQIRAEFDGDNYKFLARKYAMSEVWIRKIVSEGRT